MQRFHAKIVEHTEELAAAIVEQQGKTLVDAVRFMIRFTKLCFPFADPPIFFYFSHFVGVSWF